MSDTMTSERPPPPPGGGAWNPGAVFGGLRRSDDDRWISGLAGGIASRWGIEVWIIRLGFVVAAFVGVGLPLYLVGWLLLPSDSRPSFAQRRDWTRNTAIAVGVVLVLLLGGLAWVDGTGRGWLIPLALVAVGIGLLLRDRPLPAGTAEVPVPAADPTAASAEPPVPPVPPDPPVPVAQPASPPEPPGPPTPRRRSFLTPVTILALLAFVGIAVAVGDARWTEPGVVTAIAVGVIGLVLLLAAWAGRARGLIVVGLLLLPPLLVGLAVDGSWRDWRTDLEVRPTSTAALEEHYEWGFGRRVLDLSGLDLDPVATERVEVDQLAGDLEVLLPPDAVVDLRADVGAGVIDLSGTGETRPDREEGLGIDLDRRVRAGDGGGRLRLDVELGAGNLDIHPYPTVSLEAPR